MTAYPCTLSLVIPVYNGAKTVGELVAALEALDIPGGHEIVLVNDGSPDNSLAVCCELVARAKIPITLVDHARNYGEQQHAGWRNLGSQFTNWVAGFVLDKPKDLYLSSFRCMSAFTVREITRYDGPFPYVDGLILQVTQNIDRLLVRHLPRAVGRSNYTTRRLLRLWLSMFVNFLVMPLRISTLTGFALSLIGTVGSIIVLTEALFFAPPAGWASLMAAVLLLSGVQLLILGIVGEYLGRLYLTANRKPQSVVKSVIRAAPRRPPQTSRPSVRARERA